MICTPPKVCGDCTLATLRSDAAKSAVPSPAGAVGFGVPGIGTNHGSCIRAETTAPADPGTPPSPVVAAASSREGTATILLGAATGAPDVSASAR